MKDLSILIATVIDRRPIFEPLFKEFIKQCSAVSEQFHIEVLVDEDNKEKSIGKKRQDLLNASDSEYICFFDSDDFPREYYITEIINALKDKPDCVGFKIAMTTNGLRPQTCCHSLRYPIWKENVDGFDYVRNVTHFNVVKRSIALQVGFQDLRYGEDKPYSDGITALCKKEFFIDKFLFDYKYSTFEPHEKKYGINGQK